MDELTFDESLSMSHAVARGYVPAVDAAALTCLPVLPDSSLAVLKRPVFADDRAVALARHETSVGSIATIVLPIAANAVYAEKERLGRLVRSGFEEADRVGARVVSLTGLIPSATNLGRDLDLGDRLPSMTTGHATTVSAVVMMLADAIAAAGLDLGAETLAFVGVGSIGAATVRLALTVLPKPRRVLLCDVYHSQPRVEQLAREVNEAFDLPVDVAIGSPSAVSELVYGARIVVGATNVPNVLDVTRLLPGSVLIDDSAPHCFDVAVAAARVESRGDLVVSEGGLVRSPTRLDHRVFLPKRARHGAELLITSTLRQQAFAADQVMGCVLSAALSAGTPALPVTVGAVSPHDALTHYQALRALGFSAPPPQCDAIRFAVAR